MSRSCNHLVPVVLRLGLAVVFLWFGSQQLSDPSVWTGFVPGWTANPWISVETIILLNGFAEIVAAVLLISGFWLRPVGLLLTIHMLVIALEAGGAIGIRDFGLAISCLALALSTPDHWTLDAYFVRYASSGTPEVRR